MWGQADSASLQVYEQNDRLVQHIAKQHADELQVAAEAADPKAIPAHFCRFILPPSHYTPLDPSRLRAKQLLLFWRRAIQSCR